MKYSKIVGQFTLLITPINKKKPVSFLIEVDPDTMSIGVSCGKVLVSDIDPTVSYLEAAQQVMEAIRNYFPIATSKDEEVRDNLFFEKDDKRIAALIKGIVEVTT